MDKKKNDGKWIEVIFVIFLIGGVLVHFFPSIRELGYILFTVFLSVLFLLTIFDRF